MKNKSFSRGVLFFLLTIFFASSCTKEEVRPTFPLSATIFNSVVDKQVAFTALTHSASSWSWDFGDGTTSTEQNPVHVYESGGYYLATLTASDDNGNTVTDEVNLAVSLTPYVLLTGGPTAVNGKTWRLTTDHGTGGDYLAYANADLTVVEDTPKPLPTGIFELQFHMGDVYKDEFTFFFDGSYAHDVKEDGASFGGYVYQLVKNGGADIINANGAEFGLVIAKYTPQDGATFTYVENENFTVSSVWTGGSLTFDNVSTLDFSGTEFVGFMDFQRKVIVQKITDNSMTLVMFMAASGDYIGVNTHALILSFEVVN